MTSQPIGLQQSIRFGEDFELDLRPRRLRRGSRVLKLERIPLEILILLLERRGEIVSRDEIVARIWGNDVFLDTDNSIRGAIRKVRQVLKDDPETPRFIQTVTGRGYRFIAPVISAEEASPAELSRPEGPRVSTGEQGLVSELDSWSSEKALSQDPVLDLTSFQLVRAGQRLKLEKIPMELLALLTRKRGALVTREEIVRALWGDAVHVDVDAGINTAIRKIRLTLNDDPASPRFLETVVGKGYRFIGPITVVDNGALTPATASDPGTRSARRGIRLALLAAALAAVVLFAVLAARRAMRATSAEGQPRVVIAVLPLQNLSGDPGQAFFANGLTEEIVTQLGQLSPERIGVVRYRSSNAVPRTRSMIFGLGQRSGVQYFLEGGVRRQDQRVRISIQLVQAADQTDVWTESFDRNVGDVLTLQAEIARRIGRELQVQVLARAPRKTVAPEVLESYFRGRFELQRPSLPIAEAARAHFERAIALDPSYAPAYAGLADFYRSRAVANDAGAEQNWRMAEQYAMQALSLDGDSAEIHTAIAEIKLMHDWDWHAAREHALRALQLNPSLPDAHAVYARYLRTAGNMREAVNQRKQALALDPFREDLKEQLTMEQYFVHDFQTIATSVRQTLASDPNNQSAHEDLCYSLGHLKLFDEAVAECGKALAGEGHADWAEDYVREYRKRGYEAASLLLAKKQLNEVLQRPQRDLWSLANAYLPAGLREEALRTLFEALQIHDPGLLQIRVDPDFDSLRNDPRYDELVRQIGFPSE